MLTYFQIRFTARAFNPYLSFLTISREQILPIAYNLPNSSFSGTFFAVVVLVLCGIVETHNTNLRTSNISCSSHPSKLTGPVVQLEKRSPNLHKAQSCSVQQISSNSLHLVRAVRTLALARSLPNTQLHRRQHRPVLGSYPTLENSLSLQNLLHRQPTCAGVFLLNTTNKSSLQQPATISRVPPWPLEPRRSTPPPPPVAAHRIKSFPHSRLTPGWLRRSNSHPPPASVSCTLSCVDRVDP